MANTGPTLTVDVLDPEVIAGDVQTAATKALVIAPLIKVDTTLEGKPGSTVTLPRYKSIGMATRLAETDRIVPKKLELESAEVKIREAGDGLSFTDQSLAVSFGDPVSEATTQLGNAIAERIEYDVIEAATKDLGTKYNLNSKATNVLDWETIVKAKALFGDKGYNSLGGLVVNTATFASLLLDDDFKADTRAQGDAATDGIVTTASGLKIYVTDFINDVDPKLSSLILRKDAMALYWKTRPHISTDRDIYARTLEMAISTIYAPFRANDNGVVAIHNA